MSDTIQPRYWTDHELRELKRVVKLSLFGARPVWWEGHYVRFTKWPTVILHSAELKTVEMDYEVVEGPS